MKKLKFFKISLLILLFGGILFSCKKDEITEQTNEAESPAIDMVESRNNPSELTRENMYLVLAEAISKSLQSQGFRDFIKSKAYFESGVEEILFAEILDEVVSSDDAILFKQDIYNNISSGVRGNYSLEEFWLEILGMDPLLVIRVPDLFSEMEWNTETVESIPFARAINEISQLVYFDNGTGIDVNDLDLEQNEYVFFLKVKSSEAHLLVDFSTNNTYSGLDMIDYYGEVIMSNPEWDAYKNSDDFALTPGYKLVNKVKVFQKLFGNGNSDSDVQGRTGGEGCARDWGRDDNLWQSIELKSETVWDKIDNQPCGESEDVVDLYFYWAYFMDGDDVDREYPLTLRLGDLFSVKIVQISEVWSWSCFCTKTKVKFALVPKEYIFSTRIFNDHQYSNEWRLDNQGDRFEFRLIELDHEICETSISTEFTIKFSFSTVQKKGTTGGQNTSIQQTVETERKIKGTDKVELGHRPAFYCECPTYSSQWNMYFPTHIYDGGDYWLKMLCPTEY